MMPELFGSKIRKLKTFISGYLLNYSVIALITKRENFALNDLDHKLSIYLTKKNGFYVELGAHDGITQSNTKHLELFKGWRGVLIEPSPINYRKLKINRGKRNTLFNLACVSDDFHSSHITMKYSNLMSITLEGESEILDREEYATSGRQYWDGEIHNFEAVAETLTNILDAAFAPNEIDFLSLDVEGSEIEVLKGLDFDRYSFAYILVETTNFMKINQLLTKKNYTFITQLSQYDYLFEITK